MILLNNTITPEQAVLDALAKYQADVDREVSFENRSAKAKELFPKRNKKGNKTFNAIKVSLTAMCSGARRCVYCEDSVGDEVEHIFPKDLYPEKVFDWHNYVYACGNCNSPKNNKFAVFRDDNGQFHPVNPPHGQPAQQPPSGRPALINPRIEDPLPYAMLDLAGTFLFVILPEESTDEHQKAAYTFNEVLQFDKREFLRQAREEAYYDYRARLAEYVNRKNSGAPQAQLHKMVAQLKKKGHPTVWREMQRYHQLSILRNIDSELDDYFIAVPEALEW
jgi:uncharacterized protein (TIGR02646 family)